MGWDMLYLQAFSRKRERVSRKEWHTNDIDMRYCVSRNYVIAHDDVRLLQNTAGNRLFLAYAYQ